MAREGASKEEIRDYLERSGKGNHRLAGAGEIVGNILTGGAIGSVGNAMAAWNAVGDKISNNRAKK